MRDGAATGLAGPAAPKDGAERPRDSEPHEHPKVVQQQPQAHRRQVELTRDVRVDVHRRRDGRRQREELQAAADEAKNRHPGHGENDAEDPGRGGEVDEVRQVAPLVRAEVPGEETERAVEHHEHVRVDLEPRHDGVLVAAEVHELDDAVGERRAEADDGVRDDVVADQRHPLAPQAEVVEELHEVLLRHDDVVRGWPNEEADRHGGGDVGDDNGGVDGPVHDVAIPGGVINRVDDDSGNGPAEREPDGGPPLRIRAVGS
mmetsp:Transcript_53761/g.165409  ORF Transcript_53761/g.165409 Transcript_53761/m.165409 type:complete len:260 (-) Transcript_53761:606-1385(-)